MYFTFNFDILILRLFKSTEKLDDDDDQTRPPQRPSSAEVEDERNYMQLTSLSIANK